MKELEIERLHWLEHADIVDINWIFTEALELHRIEILKSQGTNQMKMSYMIVELKVGEMWDNSDIGGFSSTACLSSINMLSPAIWYYRY